jgi:hypothetical protein
MDLETHRTVDDAEAQRDEASHGSEEQGRGQTEPERRDPGNGGSCR